MTVSRHPTRQAIAAGACPGQRLYTLAFSSKHALVLASRLEAHRYTHRVIVRLGYMLMTVRSHPVCVSMG